MHELQKLTIQILQKLGYEVKVVDGKGYIKEFPINDPEKKRALPCMIDIEYVQNVGHFFERDIKKWCDENDILLDTRYKKGKYKVWFRDMSAPTASEHSQEYIGYGFSTKGGQEPILVGWHEAMANLLKKRKIEKMNKEKIKKEAKEKKEAEANAVVMNGLIQQNANKVIEELEDNISERFNTTKKLKTK